MRKPTQQDFMELLNKSYDASVTGVPMVSEPVEKLAYDYMKRHRTVEGAAKEMIKNQILKCTTSGVINGFGGIVTLPVSIPANITSVFYIQIRMIACLAQMGGYNLNDDQTRTFVFAVLAGVSINQFAKRFGIEFGQKIAKVGIQKIPGKTLAAINQKIGFRMFTKFGEKGLVNFGKMIPVVGAAVNGGFDYVETKTIADRAYKFFIKGEDTGKIVLEF